MWLGTKTTLRRIESMIVLPNVEHVFFFSFLSFVGRRRLRLKFYIRVYKTTRKWHAGVSEDVCYQTEEKPSSCSRLLNSNPKSTLRETGARGGFGNPTNIFILLSSVFFFSPSSSSSSSSFPPSSLLVLSLSFFGVLSSILRERDFLRLSVVELHDVFILPCFTSSAVLKFTRIICFLSTFLFETI